MLNKDFYIKYALIYAVVSIVYLMVIYLVGMDAMVSFWNMGVSIVLGIGLLVFVGLEARKLLGGYMAFSEAFKNIFIVYALGAFLYLLFNHVLNTVIDPALPGKMFQATLDKTMGMMESLNVPEEEIDKAYDQMEVAKADMKDAFTVMGFIRTYFTTLAFGAISSLIAAAITKKNNPNPFVEEN